MEYVSRACPYCGGPQIIHKDGEYVCAYCLQPLAFTSGILSDGFNKLASYNFVGAAAFFRSMAAEGAEAYYGLFLAQNKIEENRSGGSISPVVYSYRPQPFATYPECAELIELCRGNKGVLSKLEKIEKARATTLRPQTEYDAVIFTDEGSENEAAKLCEGLKARGYRVLFAHGFGEASIAELRCAQAAYAYVSGADTARELLESRVAKRFLLLENERTALTGIGKKPLKLVAREPLPALLCDALGDCTEVVAEADAAAEGRRLKLYLPMERAADAGLAKEAVPLPVPQKVRYVGEATPETYWESYLSACGVNSSSELLSALPAQAFARESLAVAENALYRSKGEAQAAQYVETLVSAALRLLDRNRVAEATRALDTAFMYDYSDIYAESIVSRIDAVTITPAEYSSVMRRVVGNLYSRDAKLRLGFILKAVDYALSCGDYARADDVIEGVLDYYPRESGLLRRKLLCENKVKSVGELLACDYPRLGDAFANYISALSAAERSKEAHKFFAEFIANARAKGFEYYGEAILELLGFFYRERIFSSEDFCTAGYAALTGEDYEAAKVCFTRATSLDSRNYNAYWGALCAALKCRDDRALEECDSEIEDEEFYAQAYKSAYGRDNAFISRMEKVSAIRRTVEKKDGHVFRAEDFIISGGVLIRYIGKGAAHVFVGGSVYKIADNAFRGCDIRSLLIGDGVAGIGSYAFAFSGLESITIPSGVHAVGVNPFCGCDKLTSVNTKGTLHVHGGGVYFGSRLIGYSHTLALASSGGESYSVKSGTAAVGAKAFWHEHNLREVILPQSLQGIEPCGFYGCEGLRVSGKVPARVYAFTGESSFGDCELSGGVLARRGDARWSSLYGDCTNNMAVGGKAAKNSTRVEKITQVKKPDGGLLLKNGLVLYTAGGKLGKIALSDGSCNSCDPVLDAAGTGVLWNEFIVIPSSEDGGSLVYVDEQGIVTNRVRIGKSVTRPLCLARDTLLCVSGSTVISVNLATNKIFTRVLAEKITSVPCSDGEKFAVAGERNLYVLDASLSGDGVYALKGVNYTENSGKILRGRIVSERGNFYWIERSDSALFMGVCDGRKTTLVNIPRGVADFMQTQPMFYGGRFYAGATRAVLEGEQSGGEWTFTVKSRAESKYNDIIMIGGEPYFCRDNGNIKLSLRIGFEGGAILADGSGGIYVARI